MSHKNAIKKVKGVKKGGNFGKKWGRFLESQIPDFADFFSDLRPIFGQKELATLICLAMEAKRSKIDVGDNNYPVMQVSNTFSKFEICSQIIFNSIYF